MKIVGSVIARLGSKRLTFKNLLPYKGEPLVVRAVRKLLLCDKIDKLLSPPIASLLPVHVYLMELIFYIVQNLLLATKLPPFLFFSTSWKISPVICMLITTVIFLNVKQV